MDKAKVREFLPELQELIVQRLEQVDGNPFLRDQWQRPQGGGGITRLIEGGDLFERGGVNFSHVMGDKLPPSATAHRPERAGRKWEAMGVSLVMHPRNPYCPTSHLNVVIVGFGKEQRKDAAVTLKESKERKERKTQKPHWRPRPRKPKPKTPTSPPDVADVPNASETEPIV